MDVNIVLIPRKLRDILFCESMLESDCRVDYYLTYIQNLMVVGPMRISITRIGFENSILALTRKP